MTVYVDSSVLLRVVLGQPNALREWRQITRGISSALITTECLRTLDRHRLRAGLSDVEVARRRRAIISAIATLELVEIDERVLERASQPMPTELGTLDAIHLSTALLWPEFAGDDLTMATHDRALAIGAQSYGMRILGVDPA